jgi:hypothetical protein
MMTLLQPHSLLFRTHMGVYPSAFPDLDLFWAEQRGSVVRYLPSAFCLVSSVELTYVQAYVALIYTRPCN